MTGWVALLAPRSLLRCTFTQTTTLHRSLAQPPIFFSVDVVKTRLQVGGKYAQLGIAGTAGVIAKEEGVISFWKGIGPAWLREASYTSLRLGLYNPIKVCVWRL